MYDGRQVPPLLFRENGGNVIKRELENGDFTV